MKSVPRYLINEKKNINIFYVDVIQRNTLLKIAFLCCFGQKTKKNA
jgi:hypothetical protein